MHHIRTVGGQPERLRKRASTEGDTQGLRRGLGRHEADDARLLAFRLKYTYNTQEALFRAK